jgi:hypothetical protein
MSHVKKIGAGLLIVFVIIQFIRPDRNTSAGPMPDDITTLVSAPDGVMSLLHRACYDCHSNNTRYPWYMNVQPMAWMMAKHVREGKEQLNFSEFGGYSPRRQVSKLTGIANSIRQNTMPLQSYLLMHRSARLSAAEKMLIKDWVQKSKDALSPKN